MRHLVGVMIELLQGPRAIIVAIRNVVGPFLDIPLEDIGRRQILPGGDKVVEHDACRAHWCTVKTGNDM